MSTQPRKHYHHGKTPAAVWGSVIAAVGFVVATVGFLLPLNWVVIAAGGAIVLLAVIVTVALRSLGYGQ